MEFTEDDRKEFDDWKSKKNEVQKPVIDPEYEEWKKTKASITKIEIKPEKVEDKPVLRKEKKERTEKQIQAFQKMRKALDEKRQGNEIVKHEHSKKYKEEMDRAYEKADKVKEILPEAKVVVKSRVGRPKGRKTTVEAPTPVYQSEEDEEEHPQPEKPVRSVKQAKSPDHVPNQTFRPSFTTMNDYLRKLNGF
jgi:hypothetical protein